MEDVCKKLSENDHAKKENPTSKGLQMLMVVEDDVCQFYTFLVKRVMVVVHS